ncbi:MAG: DUF1524 domain-containing protein [Betaproteobacteria bacterium]
MQNDSRFCKHEEDRYKVWPTNRDRPAFNEVMGASYPVDYTALKHEKARLVQAHRFFAQQAREWLSSAGTDQHQRRAEAIERSVRELLQLVVIDLSVDENAQEICETLNARGAQLTAADLIKNFVFQRLLEADADVEKAYEAHWKEFETAFWETEVSAGRLVYQRSSLFINHWLISRTGEEIVAREVFSRFKTFADHNANVPMDLLLQQMARAAGVYRRITEAADNVSGEINRVGLFAYRIKSMESDVMKSVLLALLDSERPPLPDAVVTSVLELIESWLTRRMLVRASTKNYSPVAAEIVGIIRQTPASNLDSLLRSYLTSQKAESSYWPDDDEVRAELTKMPIYRRLRRTRLRMIFEAIEDYGRGYRIGGNQYAGMRVPRTGFWIEHIMPQSWEQSWTSPAAGTAHERAQRIHTLGNLTLLTAKLNVSVSNGKWTGDLGKRAALRKHDLLLLNRDLDSFSDDEWTDDAIIKRTQALIDSIINIWQVPPGYKSSTVREAAPMFHSVDLSDLLSAGLLIPGQTIFPSPPHLRTRTGQILPDGRIDVEGQIFDAPSGAGAFLLKRNTNGWTFWLLDPNTKKSLASVRREYLESSSSESRSVDEDDDPADEPQDSLSHATL